MNRIVAILLLSLVMFLSLKDLVIFAQFYWNQDYIAQNLCLNLDEPELMCYGKCQLEISLRESQEQKEALPHLISEKKININYIVEERESILFVTDYKNSQQEFYFSDDVYLFDYLEEIFHPPQLS